VPKIGVFHYLRAVIRLNIYPFGVHDMALFWSSSFRISTRRARQYWR
jgi:hypothetical protein